MGIVFNNSSNRHLAVLSDISLHHDAMSFRLRSVRGNPKIAIESVRGWIAVTVFSFVLACHHERSSPNVV